MRPYFLSHIDRHQFAYRPRSSTTCALTHLHYRLTSLLEENDSTGVAILSLDYSKAFDTISHDMLLQRVIDCGFPKPFVTWLSSYLTERAQRTTFGNVVSSVAHVTSGVPQGSIIGPLLFILYTANLLGDINCDYVKYADDTTILIKLSFDDSSSERLICDILEHVKSKSENIKLCLNISKSNILICPKRNMCPSVCVFRVLMLHPP